MAMGPARQQERSSPGYWLAKATALLPAIDAGARWRSSADVVVELSAWGDVAGATALAEAEPDPERRMRALLAVAVWGAEL